MRLIREWILRLLGTLRPRRGDADLQEELRLHIELAAEDAQRRGETPPEALRTARLRSGSSLVALDSLRDQRGVSWIEELSRDVRHGLRTLRRSPSFTAVALLTLALGIGANAAIYQLLDAVRIRALPVKDPEQLVLLELADVTRWTGRRASLYDPLSNRQPPAAAGAARGVGDALALGPTLPRTVSQVRADFRVMNVGTQSMLVQRQLLRERLRATLSIFSASDALSRARPHVSFGAAADRRRLEAMGKRVSAGV